MSQLLCVPPGHEEFWGKTSQWAGYLVMSVGSNTPYWHPSACHTGADVDPSLSFSNISTASTWTSPHSLQTKAWQLQLRLLNQQKHHPVAPCNLCQGYMMPHTGEHMRYITSTIKSRLKGPPSPRPTTLTTWFCTHLLFV
jgi:hypothetical protein